MSIPYYITFPGFLKQAFPLSPRKRSGVAGAGRLKKQVGESTYAAHCPLK